MSAKIKDRNLSRIIKLKMCTSDINDIEEVEDISIQNINLMQNRLNIDLTEIVKLKKLRNLSLKFFEITDEFIEAINQLAHIKRIEFSMCIFKNKIELLEELQIIHSGIVDISNIKKFKKVKYLKIAHCNVISIPSITALENLEQLYLNHLEIPYDIDISKMPNLKFISLSGSNVPNKEKYIEKLHKQNEKVTIEFKEDDLPIV